MNAQKIFILGFAVIFTLSISACSTSEKKSSEKASQNVEASQNQNKNQNEKTEFFSDETALFKGTWFDIQYPKTFTATPITSSAKNNQITEVTFSSPDHAVEFYVFSPQWGGDPANYLKTTDSEKIIDEKTEESGADLTKKITKWVTIAAKDGSYFRSFVSIKEQVGTGSDTHRVFGIKYKDDAAYKKYKDAYIAFKESLRQYAD